MVILTLMLIAIAVVDVARRSSSVRSGSRELLWIVPLLGSAAITVVSIVGPLAAAAVLIAYAFSRKHPVAASST